MTTVTVPRGGGDATLTRLYPQPDPYLHDPAGWVAGRLGEHLWSKQVQVGESVVANRYTAVPSAHGTGKSFEAARLVAWWLDVHPVGEAFAVTTAPTAPQVETILWREIGRAHRKSGLKGRLTAGAVPTWKIGNEIVAYGRKPADLVSAEDAAAAFQGIHARYVLVVLDEAGGIPGWLWNAVDTLATNDDARVLAIGNPDNPASQFAEVCKPGSGWNVIGISAFDTPGFTGEAAPEDLAVQLISPQWVEERKKRWGESSPLYISKVLGQFPEVSDDTLISPGLIRQAQERDLIGLETGCFGLDIARLGDDETVCYRNRGGVVRLSFAHHKRDTMQTAGRAAEQINGVPMYVDVIGIGAGVFDRLAEQGLPVQPFDAGARAWNPVRFANRRAEAWWALRETFEAGDIDIDPADDDLAAQLSAVKYHLDSRGRVVIESKDDMRRRGVPSPDRADAVVMACLPDPNWHMPVLPKAETLTSDLLGRAM